MTTPRLLIAGVGNLFMGDDAFGCLVAQRLAQRSLPETVRIVDFGIRGLDLTYAMLDDYEAVFLVDAAPRGEAPGTLYVIEPQIERQTSEGETAMLEAHSMDPVKVLQAVAALGGRTDHILIVGCEPTPRDAHADWEMSLSEPVQAAVDEAVTLIEARCIKYLAFTALPVVALKEVFMMSLLTLATAPIAHPAIHWFDMISGVIVGIVVLVILVEFVLMIPDFIRTIKMHKM